MNLDHLASIELDVPLGLIPHADQWLGVWAMREPESRLLVDSIRSMNVKLHLSQQAQAARGDNKPEPYQVDRNNIASLFVTGRMQKHEASLGNAASTVRIRQQLRLAAQDDEVQGIMLHFDTPGGTVAGTQQLAAEIAAADKRKPVFAFIDDLCCSAGYWAASQARKIFANPTAVVGSIGTYMVIVDWAAAAARDGAKVHVIRAGAMKGAGAPGTEITPEQLADFQREINQLNEEFLLGVAAGRKLSIDLVRALADGRVHIGKAALDLKLVDGVASAEDAVAELVKLSSAQSRRTKMSTEVTTQPAAEIRPQIASLADLRKACPKADASFLLAQIERNATLDMAKDAYIELLQTQHEATRQELATAKQTKPGVDPVRSSGKPVEAAVEGDAIAQWNEAIATERKAGKSLADATRAVAHAQPELRAAYVAQYNAQRKSA